MKNQCVNSEKRHYSGTMNGTIHIVVGGGGCGLAEFSSLTPRWSLFKDHDFGFGKLTAFNHSSLLFEYKKSSDGKVYDSFTISRDYRDILSCVHDSCEASTLASWDWFGLTVKKIHAKNFGMNNSCCLCLILMNKIIGRSFNSLQLIIYSTLCKCHIVLHCLWNGKLMEM